MLLGLSASAAARDAGAAMGREARDEFRRAEIEVVTPEGTTIRKKGERSQK